jgi:Chlorite dismutase
VASRALPSFTSFTDDEAAPGLRRAGATLTRYRIDRVVPIVGPALHGVAAGRALWRVELPGELAVPDAPFIGATTHVVYTDAATRGALAQMSAGPSGPTAVLIPIQKSAEWWALAQEQRQAYLEASAASAGHIAIGKRHAARIYRRLYHARYLPGSAWDFLTYFEFPSGEAGAFSELCAALRDPKQNPEWAFVEREVELWLTRQE